MMDKKVLNALYGAKGVWAKLSDIFTGLAVHEANDGHDWRYYTEAEVDGLIQGLQAQINNNALQIGLLDSRIDNLESDLTQLRNEYEAHTTHPPP